MTESVIVTFKPYIGAAFLAAREGNLKSVRYLTSLPFDLERVDDEDRAHLDQLSAFVKRAEEIEIEFGYGAILDLEPKEICELVAEGSIRDEEVQNAKAYRASGKAVSPIALLECGA